MIIITLHNFSQTILTMCLLKPAGPDSKSQPQTPLVYLFEFPPVKGESWLR